MNDIANFLARAVLVELGQRRQIDRLDQGPENHRFGQEIALRPLSVCAFGAGRAVSGS